MRGREGSVLLLVLFVCAGVAALIVVTSTSVMMGERALLAEREGRATLGSLAEALHRESTRQAAHWQTDPPTSPPSAPALTILPSPSSGDWAARVTVRAAAATSEGGFRSLTADVERGRDGLDLPMAAVVASELSAAEVRTDAVTTVAGEEAQVFLGSPVERASALNGLTVRDLEEPWALDESTVARLISGASESPAEGVIVLTIPAGERSTLGDLLPSAGSSQAVTLLSPSGDPFAPTGAYLVVALGKGTLDARDLGDFFGIIVSSGGRLELEGTALHGAAFATEDIALGESGRIVFDKPILRWATDRSLVRTRLVPGSRREASVP